MKGYKMLLKVAVACAALFVTPMFAQNGSDIKVNVPFAFRIGQQSLPAGQYTLHTSAGSALLLIQERAGNSSMAMVLHDAPAAANTQAQVVFRVYGATRYLGAIRIPGACGVSVPQSSLERELASVETPTELTLVAMRGR
ncbi:MAG TPA: hypothetical protein VLY04_08805 [Bryobacteraceae bacterium]|nr:hypothetical protein [Bryobacteraceae bacterium]